MKIAAFITVRLGSTRLPNKALLEIKGKPTISHLIERIKQVKNIDQIVLCTTINQEDEKLIKLANELEIDSFAGDETDIIKRHLDAAKQYNVDFVINVDGDDILCDPDYIDELAKDVREKPDMYDVIKTEGLPFGVNSFGYDVKCLKSVFENKTQDDSDTGWGAFFRENKDLRQKVIPAKKKHLIKDKTLEPRMSLDYKEDLEFFDKVITALYKEGKYFSLDEIFHFLKQHPEVVKINKEVEKLYWENYEKKKIIKN